MVWILVVLLLLVLLFSFPKQMGVLIGIILLGIAGGFLYYQEEERQKNAVDILVKYDLNTCSITYPLNTTIRNRSNRKVNKVSWGFTANKKGYSSNVLRYHASYSSDKIINSMNSFSLCYKAPKMNGSFDPKSLNWSTDGNYVKFDK